MHFYLLSNYDSSLNNPKFLPRFPNDVHGALDLAWLMRGGDRGPQARKSLRDGRRDNREDKDIMVLGLAGHFEGLLVVAAQDRDDGRLCQHRVETHAFQATDELLRVLVKPLNAP